MEGGRSPGLSNAEVSRPRISLPVGRTSRGDGVGELGENLGMSSSGGRTVVRNRHADLHVGPSTDQNDPFENEKGLPNVACYCQISPYFEEWFALPRDGNKFALL